MSKFDSSVINDDLATSMLREASIGRQQQAGSLDPSQVETIRQGGQDQSIGFEDAKYALQHADVLWGKAQQAVGQKQGSSGGGSAGMQT
jgi:hypothetical protein